MSLCKVVLTLAAAAALVLTGCAQDVKRECADLRVRVDRDPRTDRIVSVEVLCDGRVVPQAIIGTLNAPKKEEDPRHDQ